MSDRKQQIMEHLARSTGKFVQQSTNSQVSADRKQRILEHVRRTRG